MWKCLICEKKVKDLEAHHFVMGHYAFENLTPKEKRNDKTK